MTIVLSRPDIYCRSPASRSRVCTNGPLQLLSKEKEEVQRYRKRKNFGEEDRLEKRRKMAAKGVGGADGGKKNGENGEDTIKRGRGRPRKGADGGEGAEAMRRFLESKGEEAAFEKSQKVQHTPEKNKEEKEREELEVEKGENTLTDGEHKGDKDGVTTEQKTTTGKGSEGETASGSGDEVMNKEAEKGEEKKEGENEGMRELVAGWMKESLDRVGELECRLNDALVRIGEGEKEIEQLKVKNRQIQELVITLEEEVTLLSVGQAKDRARINELETKIENITKIARIKDVNQNECEGENCKCGHTNSERGAEERRERGGKVLDRSEDGDRAGNKNVNTDGRTEGEGASARVEDRKYLHCIPTALGKGEYEREKEERESRKKNLMIKGIRTVGKGLNEEVKRVVKELMDVDIYIKKVSAIEGGLVVELESFKNKIDILKRKGRLRGINLWIEDDYTKREKEVQAWLGMIAEEESKRGHDTKVGYQKVRVDGEWYEWNERKGEVEPMNFRREKGE